MSTAESYGAFAFAYDQALGERYFRAVRRLLADVLDRYPSEAKSHLDVCCGTALAMPFFTSRGFVSTGVDISPVMLAVARKRAKRLVGGNVCALPLRGVFSRITCLYDSLNHLLDRRDLVAAFSEVARVMDGDSLFIFDMNHPEIYPEVWGMKEPFIESGTSFHLEIATRYSRPEKRGHALVTGWATLPNGERAKIHETHEQRAWSRREIVGALREAHLTALSVDDFDPFSEGRVVKLVFTCRPA